jgi:hypothetical protein
MHSFLVTALIDPSRPVSQHLSVSKGQFGKTQQYRRLLNTYFWVFFAKKKYHDPCKQLLPF